MSQSLPEYGFAWVNVPESVGYINVSEDAEARNILEVDLEYSVEIHDNTMITQSLQRKNCLNQ